MRLPGFSLLHSSLHFRDLWQLLQRKPVRYANRREGRKHTRNTLSNFVCLFAGTCSSLSVIVASRYSDHPSRITASSPKSTTTGVIDPGDHELVAVPCKPSRISRRIHRNTGNTHEIYDCGWFSFQIKANR